MPSNRIIPEDSDELERTDDDNERHGSKSRHHHHQSSSKDRNSKGYHRSSSSKHYHRSSSRRDKDSDDDRGHRHSSSHKYREKDRDHRHKDYHRSSSSRKSRDYDHDKEKDRNKDRHRRHHRDRHRSDMIIEDVEGDDEHSDVDYRKERNILRQQSRASNQSSPPKDLKVDVSSIEEKQVAGSAPAGDESDKIAHMFSGTANMSPRRAGHTPHQMKKQFGGGAARRSALNADDRANLNMFFREDSKYDSLADYLPSEDEGVLESISEILFKPYPWQLKLFAAFICISQFLTLISLFYSLLPCPETKPSWLVFIGVPLCCAYAGIESIHHMLRYIHLGKGYRILVFLMNINCLMQLLCVGVVMGKSENLVSLIGNFVGVAIVLQIDEFLAVYIGIKDIDPLLLEKKSWRTKMMLKSKMWLIAIAALIVYAVTLTCWRVDYLYCDSYDLESNINDVDAGRANPGGGSSI